MVVSLAILEDGDPGPSRYDVANEDGAVLPDNYASKYEHNPVSNSTWTTMEYCSEALRDALVFGKTIKYGKDEDGPLYWKWSKGRDGREKVFRNTQKQRDAFLREWKAQQNIANHGTPNLPKQQQQTTLMGAETRVVSQQQPAQQQPTNDSQQQIVIIVPTGEDALNYHPVKTNSENGWEIETTLVVMRRKA